MKQADGQARSGIDREVLSQVSRGLFQVRQETCCGGKLPAESSAQNPDDAVRAQSGAPRGQKQEQLVAFRRACEKDIPVLVDFRVDFLREVKNIPVEAEPSLRKDLAEMFREGFESGRTLYWLAETAATSNQESGSIAGNPPVASCALYFPRGAGGTSRAGPGGVVVHSWKPRKAELMGVYTLPNSRKSGIASSLVRLVLAEARKMELREISLQPTEAARSLYLKAGFREDSDRMILDLRRQG